MSMTESERYLFDLNGYLVIPGVLSQEEVDEINEVIDRTLPSWDIAAKANHIISGWDEESTQRDTDPAKGPIDFYAGQLLDWGEPIRRLVGHKKILPYLIEMMGPTLRLDHQYAVLMKQDCSVHAIHGGGTPYDPTGYFHFKDNQFYNGLMVASFALTDAPAGAGGFCCVPASHKSNLPLPQSFKNLAQPAECVVQIPLRRGDVLIFTEALTHGCFTWKARHERRALLFKYCPGHMQWEPRSPFVSLDYQWEDHQRNLLTRPYFGGRPVIINSVK